MERRGRLRSKSSGSIGFSVRLRSKSTGSVGLSVNLASDRYGSVRPATYRKPPQRSHSQPPSRCSRFTLDIVEELLLKSLYHPKAAFMETLAPCDRKLLESTPISRRPSGGSSIPPSTDASPVLPIHNARILRVTRRSTPHNSPPQVVATGDNGIEFPTRRLFGGELGVPDGGEEQDEFGGSETRRMQASIRAAYDSLSGFLRLGSRNSAPEGKGDPVIPTYSETENIFMTRSSSNFRHCVELHTDRWRESSYDKLDFEVDDFLFDSNGACTIS
eukprot:GHVS01007000.1.p1 GENE.GHVS01007000.1~~GHVS01007000.1.p1  ORF type:complete len:274 (+),score=10.48 GHVS01007000.1:379-1200(+)